VIGSLLAALGAVLAWIWRLDPPVMTLLALSVVCGIAAMFLYPKERGAVLWVGLVRTRTGYPTHPGDPQARDDFFSQRDVVSGGAAPEDPGELAPVIPLRPDLDEHRWAG
jgi:hypothetical protein